MNSKKSKIIFVTEYFPTSEDGDISGGVEARAFYMAREIAKKASIKIITSWKRGQDRISKIGDIEVLRVGPHHGYSNKGSFVSRARFSRAIYKALIQEKADVVDAFNFTSYIPAYRGARKIGAKAVATYHETWIGNWISNKGLATGLVGEILERKALNLDWDQILPVSTFTKNRLQAVGVNPQKLHVVPNGVTLSNFQDIPSKKGPTFRIISVSRLVKTKRIDTLIEAISILKDENIECVIVGDGDQRGKLENMATELGIASHIQFRGRILDNADVISEIKQSHAFCLPSAVEGFGITVVEAMASDIPVICSDIAPLLELTSNGKYGLNFALGNANDLASKILELKTNEKTYSSFQKHATSRAKEYDWKTIADGYLRVVGRQ